jgi:hypothetical protein
MIVFTLKCRKDHRFEGWFRNGDAYEAQAKAHEIACPHCGDIEIGKAPMAPAIVSGASSSRREQQQAEQAEQAESAAPSAPAPPDIPLDPAHAERAAMLRTMLTELRTQIEKTADYVGPEFAEEARAIHYGEKEARPIYGESSDEQAKELAEEGIEFARIPWLPRQN